MPVNVVTAVVAKLRLWFGLLSVFFAVTSQPTVVIDVAWDFWALHQFTDIRLQIGTR